MSRLLLSARKSTVSYRIVFTGCSSILYVLYNIGEQLANTVSEVLDLGVIVDPVLQFISRVS